MKILNGAELAGYIKERQAKDVRRLKQSMGINPKLAIIRTNPDPVVDSYMRLKTAYGEDIGVLVDVHTIDQNDVSELLEKLNNDPSIHGIIVQIPLPDPSQTDEILNMVSKEKDVDGLAMNTRFDAPTPLAINWLLAGYNVELLDKKITIVGQGRLVGSPLLRMWEASGLNVSTVDRNTSPQDLMAQILDSDIIVSATGVPGLITAEMIKPNVVIVDAGVATDKNGLVGDVDPRVRDLPDITITPEKGGVGPLTVCALFDNVIKSAGKLA